MGRRRKGRGGRPGRRPGTVLIPEVCVCLSSAVVLVFCAQLCITVLLMIVWVVPLCRMPSQDALKGGAINQSSAVPLRTSTKSSVLPRRTTHPLYLFSSLCSPIILVIPLSEVRPLLHLNMPNRVVHSLVNGQRVACPERFSAKRL